MGRIIDRMKKDVLEKFEQEKDKTDLLAKINEDGFGFEIKRSNGVTLEYDGTTREFKTK